MLVLLLSLGLTLLASGCLDAREAPEAEMEPCAACHGDTTRAGDALSKAAPPSNLDGQTAVDALGVGAHQIHLDPAGFAATVDCATCHVVPEQTYSPGHIDTPLPAEVTFGDAGSRGGRMPRYDADEGSCSDVYCHGDAEPVWLEPRSPEDACGTCHALPPPPPHPIGDDCSACHGEVIDAAGDFTAPELHVNGEVNVGELSCDSCHGTGKLGAPPPDREGRDAVSERGVGAHRNHLEGSYSHEPVECKVCHRVPEAVDDEGHIDDSPPADVRLRGLAALGGANPSYDAETLSCSDSYCHGDATPVWTEPRSSDDACGSCHGVPPAAPHPQISQCGRCHSSVMNLDGDFIDASLHVNGRVDVEALECDSCHGAGSQGAPPPDLTGSTDPTLPGVGAHQRHLTSGDTHAAIPCTECHVVPETIEAEGHQDGLPVELVFGSLASAQGSDPVYSFDRHTCTDSYCHLDATPNWIEPLPVGSTCGSCHGSPPPLPHPPRADCSACHGAVIAADGTFEAPERHVDGKLDVVELSCNSCHGTTADGEPPPDLSGNMAPSDRGVGAHQVHLGGGDFRPLACGECHLVPQTVDDTGHVDDWGRAEVSMSGVAAIETSSPAWDRTTSTCTDSWCHGPRGAHASSPAWDDPSDLDCSSCHGFPPPLPHPPSTACAGCHYTVDDSLTFVLPDRHVDGVVDVSLNCRSCHGSGTSSAPPVDLYGNTDPSSPGVGAHQVHLAPRPSFRPVECGDCHVVPTAIADPRHIDDWDGAEVPMSGIAEAESSVPSWDPSTLTCSNTWCHGPRVVSVSPEWTSGSLLLDCDGCHGFPPSDFPHPETIGLDCAHCHSRGGIDMPENHVNGELNLN